MPQKHVLPGSNPGWGTRFFRASEGARACSFTTWMWQTMPRRAQCALARLWPRGGVWRARARAKQAYLEREERSLAVAQRPARVVRDDEAAGSNPAGETKSSRRRNSEDRVPPCRGGSRGFKSRRCRQPYPCSSADRERDATNVEDGSSILSWGTNTVRRVAQLRRAADS